MTEKESSHFKVIADDVKPDATLKEERGWHKMDVRWLVTGKNMDSKQTVVGRTIMPPGVKSRHAIHRHPNAEEWEYIISGVARKHCRGRNVRSAGRRARIHSAQRLSWTGERLRYGDSRDALGLLRRLEPRGGRLRHSRRRQGLKRRRERRRSVQQSGFPFASLAGPTRVEFSRSARQ